MSNVNSDRYVYTDRYAEQHYAPGGVCPGCGVVMSVREASEIGLCAACGQ